MNQYIEIKHPEYLIIQDDKRSYYGAKQTWYKTFIKRLSGCGPTSASNVLWYIQKTRTDNFANIYLNNANNKKEMLDFMNEIWTYITPGTKGVNNPDIFTKGIEHFASDHQIKLKTNVLNVGQEVGMRPTKAQVLAFLTEAICNDLAIAFLNLSNGSVKNLDNWHWVTLVGIDQNLQATMFDQGLRQVIDLDLWLDTTTLGGAFVVVMPE